MDYYGPFDAGDLAKNRFLPRFDAGALLTTRVAYDANDNEEYLGLAAPGADEDDPVWLVRKITYGANGKPSAILFAGGAGGKAAFGYSWTDRASHTYA